MSVLDHLVQLLVVAGCYDRDSISCRDYLHQLSDYERLKNNFAP
jgi:hypothetical protein